LTAFLADLMENLVYVLALLLALYWNGNDWRTSVSWTQSYSCVNLCRT